MTGPASTGPTLTENADPELEEEGMSELELEPDVERMIVATSHALGVDTNTLLRAVFGKTVGVDPTQGPRRSPTPGQLTATPPADGEERPTRDHMAQEEFRPHLAAALLELGGRGRAGDVIDQVHEAVAHRLTDDDLQALPSGNEPRWRNYARWERKRMVEDGLLEKDSPRGTWELSDEGRKYAESIS